MLIALNASSSRGLGSSHIGLTFTRIMQEYVGPHQFVSWVPESWGVVHRESNQARVEVVRNSSARKLLVDNWHLRAGLVRHRVDALLSLTDTSLPWPGVPHVLFVQQAFLAYQPSRLGFRLDTAFQVKMAVMASYFRLGLGAVNRIVVQTEHMKSALCDRWNVKEERVEVIPTFVQMPEVCTKGVERGEADICVIGSAAQHKNLSILPAVLELVARKISEVRCFVTLNEVDVPELVAEAARRGVRRCFRFVGTLSHEEALRLTSSARVSVLPSKLESFGLPYWEGLALGVPMVVSDLVFGREICGECAEYANPDDPEEWADKIVRLIEDVPAATFLSSGARKRFMETAISPEEMVGRFIKVVEEVAG